MFRLCKLGPSGCNALLVVAGLALLAAPTLADRPDYDFKGLQKLSRAAAHDGFVAGLWPHARKAGIRRSVFDAALADFDPDPEVLDKANNQPEFNTPVWTYIDKRVSDTRIASGRAKRQELSRTLAGIEDRYGVDRHVLLAFWGLESNFGSHKGDKSVIRSLATIAHGGRRADFGREQLVAALKILQNGDIAAAQFTGSWAGAMGHTQFIPATYNAYAVDWTGDGTRDIWNSVADALASTANYVSKSGWKPGRPWGWEVSLPEDFDYANAGPAGERSMAAWAQLGVRPAGGGRFGVPAVTAQLVLPAGMNGPAFLVTANFRAILRYNNSLAYALAVGLLADRIRGAGPLKARWPDHERVLSLIERQELQQLLNRHGYDTGGAMGHIGPKTFAAIQSYQKRLGMPADGFASSTLLERLRRSR